MSDLKTPSDEAYYHFKKAMFHLSMAEDAMSRAGLSREYEIVAKKHAFLHKVMRLVWGES